MKKYKNLLYKNSHLWTAKMEEDLNGEWVRSSEADEEIEALEKMLVRMSSMFSRVSEDIVKLEDKLAESEQLNTWKNNFVDTPVPRELKPGTMLLIRHYDDDLKRHSYDKVTKIRGNRNLDWFGYTTGCNPNSYDIEVMEKGVTHWLEIPTPEQEME